LLAQLKTPIQTGKVDLIIQNADSTKYLFSEKTDANGQFIFRNLELTKNAQAYYNGTNISKKDALVDVNLFPHFTEKLKDINIGYIANVEVPKDVKLNLAINAEISGFNKYMQLQEVRVKAKKTIVIDSINKEYVSGLFENSDQTIILKDEPGFNILQVLQRNISGFTVLNTDSGRYAIFNRYFGVDALSENGLGTIQFFLNEQPVTLNDIEFIVPADIAVIKVYKGGLGYVLGAPRGGIGLYTVKGRNTKDWRDKSFTKINLKGYEPNYQFYSMDYSKINSTKVTTDYRPLLYWNPNLKIDELGKAKITFAIDDYKGPWLLQLQGVNSNNEPIYFRKQIY
jgi:hypothetical protein